MALAMAMGIGLLAGCGGAKGGDSTGGGTASQNGKAADLSEYISSEEEGKVLNNSRLLFAHVPVHDVATEL